MQIGGASAHVSRRCNRQEHDGENDHCVEPGLCISTTPNTTLPLTCDVAKDGLANPQWRTPVNQYITWTQPQLWLVIDPSQPGVGNFYQPVSVIYDYETVATAPAYWSLTNETGVIGPAGLPSGQALQINSTLKCETNGWGNYTIAFVMIPYEPIIVFFQKQCVKPMMEIGTFVGDSNVVHNSKAVKTFAPYIYTAAQTNLTFQVALNAVQSDPAMQFQPFTLMIGSSDPTELTIQAIDPWGWNGWAVLDWNQAIDVRFTCTGKTQGAIDIGVWGVLDYGWSIPVPFRFHYRCGVGERVFGLDVYNVKNSVPMALDGLAIPPWNGTFHYSPDQTYDWGLVINSTNPASNGVTYNITQMSEDQTVWQFTTISPTWGTINFLAGETVPIVFLSSIVCQNPGAARGLVQLEFGNFIPIQFQFMYECIFPLFNIGDEPLSNNIISLGVPVSPPWPGHATADKQTAQFFIMLDSTSTIFSNSYSFPDPSADANFLVPTASDPNGGNATKSPDSDKNPVTVTFNCVPCVEAYGNPLTVSIYVGWAKPLQFQMTKDCVPTDAELANCGNQSPGKNGPWTPAAIGCFVTFLLITGFCISGCIFNRFKEDKRGWAIIPGAESLIACVDSCRSGGRNTRWSPQDNDTDTSSGPSYQSSFAAQGHANYSTNL